LPRARVPDLSAKVSEGPVTIREVLAAVLNSVRVTDWRNYPTDKPVCPVFVVTADYVYISSPGGCCEHKFRRAEDEKDEAAHREHMKDPKAYRLEALLDEKTKGFIMPEGATVSDWLVTIKCAHPAFRYYMDNDPGMCPKLSDVPTPDISALTSDGSLTVRQVLRDVLYSVHILDPREDRTNLTVCPTYVVTNDYIFIGSPAGCAEYEASRFLEAKRENEALKGTRTPKELQLEAVLNQEVKGFSLKEGCTLEAWMDAFKERFPGFRYGIDGDEKIQPALAGLPVGDLSGAFIGGTFTLRQMLRCVLRSLKVVGDGENPALPPVSPTFIVTPDSIYISTPAGCEKRRMSITRQQDTVIWK
jgi:hypothetical protein